MKIKQKLTAIMMTTVLLGSNLLSLGGQVIAASSELQNQNKETIHSNVEFDTYLDGNVHEKTFSIEEDGKMYVKLQVKESGYLKNGIVEFSNVNYDLNSEQIESENVNKIEDKTMYLNQISANEQILVEVPISISREDIVDKDLFSKISEITLKGTYVDAQGKENAIEQTVQNQVKWTANPEVELEGNLSKYLPYQIGEEYGLLVQSKITNGLKQNILPTAKTNLEITVPTINNLKPERVTVIANSTKATNGLEEGTNFNNENYEYDQVNGVLKITVENVQENQNKISWKDGKDEYIITYVFTGKEIYDFANEELEKAAAGKLTEEQIVEGQTNEDAITGEIAVKATIETYCSEEKTAILEAAIPYTTEEAKGNLADFNIESTESISKGYIYANYTKIEKEKQEKAQENQKETEEQEKKIEEKKETEYEVTYSTEIYDINITKEIEFDVNSEKIVGQETEDVNNNIESKQMKIREDIFQKILGSEGKIEILKENGDLINIINSETAKDEQGNYILNIAEEKINKIVIKTSAPIIEGKIEITLQKAFVTEQSYDLEEMKEFSKIITSVTSKTNTDSKELQSEISLVEPVSKAQINIEQGKEKLSTIVKNEDVNINVVLDTSEVTNALYKNPIIQIFMPKQIKDVEIKDSEILLDDELKIKEAKVVEQDGRQVILVALEGTQTKYQSYANVEQKNIINKGTNIILTTDITVDPLSTSKQEQITMFYINENTDLYEKTYTTNARTTTTVGTESTTVSIIAPTGVSAVNKISGYDEETSEILSLDGEALDAKIEIYAEKKDVKIEGIVTNNYTNNIENTVILGRLPFEGNKTIDGTDELGSTYNVIMKSQIEVAGIDESQVKIYYSTNGEATKDLSLAANGWTETVNDLSTVKSYLIVLSGEVAAATQITFTYTAELPENLAYNNNSYFNYKVYYDNKTENTTISETKTAGVINITTGTGPELEVELTSNMKIEGTEFEGGEEAEFEDKYYILNGLTSRFFLKVTNISKIDAVNVTAKVNIPEDIKLKDYDEGTNVFEDIDSTIIIGNIKAGETKTIDFNFEADCQNSEKIDIELETNVSISADNMEKNMESNILYFNIIESKFKQLFNETDTLETKIYSKTNIIKYRVHIKPSINMTNLKLHVPLPTDAKVINAYWENDSSNMQGITYKEGEILAEFDGLQEEKIFYVEYQLTKDENAKYSTQVYVEENDIESYYSNERFIYVGKTNLFVEQIKSEKVYVKEGEEFQYKFIINTLGSGTQTGFVFKDELDKNIKYVNTNIQMECPDDEDYSQLANIYYDENDNKVYISIPTIPANTKMKITLTVAGSLELNETEGKKVENTATIQSEQIEVIETNSVTNYIEYSKDAHINQNTGKVEDSSGNEQEGNSEKPSTERYIISGTAWIDSDKNGEKNETEQVLSNVEVMLIYKNNNKIVTDIDNKKEKIVKTDENGKYEFTNLEPNQYLVVFLHDSGKYSITEYQKQGIGESYNSDAINMKVTLYGKTRYAGVTNTIKITNSNIRDIDIGLYEANKFDLRLDKYITKITLTTPTIGTKVYEYNNSQLEKIEVLSKNVNNSSIVVEYKIVVTNEGQVAGYARKIIDYLPQNAKFNTEINKNWYISDNNQTVYNASLSETIIKPGESKEVNLILTFNITDKNIGTIINNNAEIYESYNELGLADMDSVEANMLAQEDDMSKADIVLSVVTGKIIVYTTIGLVVVAILGIGIYQIKKRVLR